jgi:hypothetical protein
MVTIELDGDVPAMFDYPEDKYLVGDYHDILRPIIP